MRIKPTLKLEKLPRMADFAEWGEAISQAMGYPPMTFLEIYEGNRNEQNVVAVNENLVGSLVVRYVLEYEKQYGLISQVRMDSQDFYKDLINFAQENEIDIRNRQFPKNVASFCKKLRTVIPSIRAAYGIIIEIGRDSATNTSVITISRKESKNIADNDESASGGTESSEAIDSISPNQENAENSNSVTNDNNTNSGNSADDKVDKNIGDRNDD